MTIKPIDKFAAARENQDTKIGVDWVGKRACAEKSPTNPGRDTGQRSAPHLDSQ
jgi:hypothetical protein